MVHTKGPKLKFVILWIKPRFQNQGASCSSKQLMDLSLFKLMKDKWVTLASLKTSDAWFTLTDIVSYFSLLFGIIVVVYLVSLFLCPALPVLVFLLSFSPYLLSVSLFSPIFDTESIWQKLAWHHSLLFFLFLFPSFYSHALPIYSVFKIPSLCPLFFSFSLDSDNRDIHCFSALSVSIFCTSHCQHPAALSVAPPLAPRASYRNGAVLMLGLGSASQESTSTGVRTTNLLPEERDSSIGF